MARATQKFGRVISSITSPIDPPEAYRCLKNLRYLLRNCAQSDSDVFSVLLQQFLVSVGIAYPAGVFRLDIRRASFFQSRPEHGASLHDQYRFGINGLR